MHEPTAANCPDNIEEFDLQAERQRDVESRLAELYANVSVEDIYPISADATAQANAGLLAGGLDALRRGLRGEDTAEEATLAELIHSSPTIIPTLRALIGEHETTFRLITSVELYRAGLCGCTDRPTIHAERALVGMAGRRCNVAAAIAQRLLRLGLAAVLNLCLTENLDTTSLTDLLNTYRMKQRLAKLR